VTSRLPLFPLGTVLFPGLVLPLHIFEERYRRLVRDLTALPEGTPREFGVVAIRAGREVASPGPKPGGGTGPTGGGTGPDSGAPGGGDAGPGNGGGAGGGGNTGSGGAGGGDAGGLSAAGVSLYGVGCTAEIRQVTELADGGFDLVTVGRRRFRLLDLDEGAAPYLTAEVEWLTDAAGPDEVADLLAPRVIAVFRQYLGLIRPDPEEISEQLPEDPTVLSHLVAATAALTVADRQRLLAIDGTAGRLRAELRLLNRETALLRQVRAVPVPLAELTGEPSPT
jgi:uncharacterized protein